MSSTEQNATATRTEYVGFAAVDSGQLLLVDPSYVTGDSAGKLDYEEVVRTNFDGGGQVTIGGGPALAYTSFTIQGDGIYPVLAELDESGHRRRLVVDLSPEPQAVQECLEALDDKA